MADKELSVSCQGAELPALLSGPREHAKAGIVLLHPASDGSRHQFLFDHLARVLPAQGIAVLRYDRRRVGEDRDVPYLLQAEDLRHGLELLAREIGPVPTGLWGFSQGAWVALLAAAADPGLAFLVLVGCSAVSPARQMRYGTAEQLRRAGFGSQDLAELDVLRTVWEQHQRGQLSREAAQQVVDRFRGRPWFTLSWIRPELPDKRVWDDMDFDPASAISRIHCPVLAFYGQDEWIPVPESIDVWRRSVPEPAQLTIQELPGTSHHPTLAGRRDLSAISPQYTAILTGWLDEVLARENS